MIRKNAFLRHCIPCKMSEETAKLCSHFRAWAALAATAATSPTAGDSEITDKLKALIGVPMNTDDAFAYHCSWKHVKPLYATNTRMFGLDNLMSQLQISTSNALPAATTPTSFCLAHCEQIAMLLCRAADATGSWQTFAGDFLGVVNRRIQTDMDNDNFFGCIISFAVAHALYHSHSASLGPLTSCNPDSGDPPHVQAIVLLHQITHRLHVKPADATAAATSAVEELLAAWKKHKSTAQTWMRSVLRHTSQMCISEFTRAILEPMAMHEWTVRDFHKHAEETSLSYPVIIAWSTYQVLVKMQQFLFDVIQGLHTHDSEDNALADELLHMLLDCVDDSDPATAMVLALASISSCQRNHYNMGTAAKAIIARVSPILHNSKVVYWWLRTLNVTSEYRLCELLSISVLYMHCSEMLYEGAKSRTAPSLTEQLFMLCCKVREGTEDCVHVLRAGTVAPLVALQTVSCLLRVEPSMKSSKALQCLAQYAVGDLTAAGIAIQFESDAASIMQVSIDTKKLVEFLLTFVTSHVHNNKSERTARLTAKLRHLEGDVHADKRAGVVKGLQELFERLRFIQQVLSTTDHTAISLVVHLTDGKSYVLPDDLVLLLSEDVLSSHAFEIAVAALVSVSVPSIQHIAGVIVGFGMTALKQLRHEFVERTDLIEWMWYMQVALQHVRSLMWFSNATISTSQLTSLASLLDDSQQCFLRFPLPSHGDSGLLLSHWDTYQAAFAFAKRFLNAEQSASPRKRSRSHQAGQSVASECSLHRKSAESAAFAWMQRFILLAAGSRSLLSPPMKQALYAFLLDIMGKAPMSDLLVAAYDVFHACFTELADPADVKRLISCGVSSCGVPADSQSVWSLWLPDNNSPTPEYPETRTSVSVIASSGGGGATLLSKLLGPSEKMVAVLSMLQSMGKEVDAILRGDREDVSATLHGRLLLRIKRVLSAVTEVSCEWFTTAPYEQTTEDIALPDMFQELKITNKPSLCRIAVLVMQIAVSLSCCIFDGKDLNIPAILGALLEHTTVTKGKCDSFGNTLAFLLYMEELCITSVVDIPDVQSAVSKTLKSVVNIHLHDGETDDTDTPTATNKRKHPSKPELEKMVEVTSSDIVKAAKLLRKQTPTFSGISNFWRVILLNKEVTEEVADIVNDEDDLPDEESEYSEMVEAPPQPTTAAPQTTIAAPVHVDPAALAQTMYLQYLQLYGLQSAMMGFAMAQGLYSPPLSAAAIDTAAIPHTSSATAQADDTATEGISGNHITAAATDNRDRAKGSSGIPIHTTEKEPGWGGSTESSSL